MIATGWASAVLFLLLIAPGLLYDLRARRWRISPYESAFAEVGRITLASLAFSITGALAAFGCWAWFDNLHFDIEEFLLEREYMVANLSRALLLLAISTAVSCRAAWSWDAWERSKKGSNAASVKAHSEWYEVFRDELPDGSKPYVKVRLRNGAQWLGWVEDYTSGVHDTTRSLVLSGQMFRQGEKIDDALVELSSDWSRVILNGEDIAEIYVRYRKHPKA